MIKVRPIAAVATTVAVAALSLLGAVTATRAQDFPNKAITIVTGVGPGSNFDLLGRLFAERLRQKLGVPVVFENVTGGQGVIATQRVLGAKSDAYTLLIAGSGLGSTPLVMKNPGYKASDFIAVAPLGQVPFILYASNKMPATDIPSLMAYLKTNAKDINSGYTTNSTVSLMLSRKFGKLSGGDWSDIGYRSSPEMILALLAGDLSLAAMPNAIGGQHAAAGKIRAIGVTGNQRTSVAPDLPTFKEMGYPTLIMNSWEGLFVKADMPADILNKIKTASREILADPSYLSAMAPTGMEEWKIPFDTVQSAFDDEAKAFARDAEELKIKFD